MRGPVPKNQPPQRDPIFRDAKVLLFWCDQQQKELLVRHSFLLSHRTGVYPGLQTVSNHLQTPYIKYSMVLCTCYK